LIYAAEFVSPSKRQRPTTGKGKGRGASTPSSGPAPRQRLGLLIFGVALALLFAGFAIDQGIGSPSVPSGDVAIVQDTPGDIGNISKAELDKAILQVAGQAGQKAVPKPGSKQYDELEETAFGNLLDSIWIQSEAAEMGVTVTPKQISDEFKSIKAQNFKTKAEYAEFLKTSHLDQSEVDERVELQILSTELQKLLTENAPAPSKGAIEDYYEEEKATQFTTKPTRDARIVVNKSKAKAERAQALLEKDDSPASWKKVAAKYSTDPNSKAKGGLLEGVSEETLGEPLGSTVFEAPIGQVQAAVKGPSGYTVVEVEKASPEKVQPFAEVQSQISSQLAQEIQQETFTEFLSSYTSKWTSRTFCDSSYAIERCSNFKGTGHPESAPPGCYEANPKAGPPEACPAPVQQLAPAIPGSVTRLVPKGQQLPQRPQPEGLEPAGEEAPVPGAVPGAAPPPAEAPPPSG
jgi:parvulin-like peptidyl-prolyl isomerase